MVAKDDEGRTRSFMFSWYPSLLEDAIVEGSVRLELLLYRAILITCPRWGTLGIQ